VTGGDRETGLKWWLRYVVVPLIGGGGVIAIIVALIGRPNHSNLATPRNEPTSVEDQAPPSKNNPPIVELPVSEPPAPQPLPHDLKIFEATASSARFEPINVLDDEVSTNTWLDRWISADGEAEGAWLELHLPEPATVTAIKVFMVIENRWAGGQIRDAELIFADQSRQSVRFPFEAGWQQVEIDPVRTDLVRVLVKSVYPGQERRFGVDVFEVKLVGYE
jgi:hypothetical protein